MQTILGSGGAIGTGLAHDLRKYTDKIRLVSRHPEKVNAEDEIYAADLLDSESVDKAVKGSEVVYLTAGLPYQAKVWERDWPVIMNNVIEACLKNNASLVFFDNVYMYAPEAVGHMTEDSTVAPATKKGKVREQLVQKIFEAIQNRRLTAMVTRSADFYGKEVANGFLNIGVFDNFKKGKKAFWQAKVHKIHSFTYVPDATKAVALLGNTPEAYGQVWHLPTSGQKWTGKDFIEFIAAELKIKPRFYILSKMLLSILGIFSPTLRELKEMQYQNDRDYFFDSSKFEKKFQVKATDYEAAIKEILSAQ